VLDIGESLIKLKAPCVPMWTCYRITHNSLLIFIIWINIKGCKDGGIWVWGEGLWWSKYWYQSSSMMIPYLYFIIIWFEPRFHKTLTPSSKGIWVWGEGLWWSKYWYQSSSMMIPHLYFIIIWFEPRFHQTSTPSGYFVRLTEAPREALVS
jgi:hypothetical protein